MNHSEQTVQYPDVHVSSVLQPIRPQRLTHTYAYTTRNVYYIDTLSLQRQEPPPLQFSNAAGLLLLHEEYPLVSCRKTSVWRVPCTSRERPCFQLPFHRFPPPLGIANCYVYCALAHMAHHLDGLSVPVLSDA